eukprot:5373158-Prymnesium_polylepis.1
MRSTAHHPSFLALATDGVGVLRARKRTNSREPEKMYSPLAIASMIAFLGRLPSASQIDLPSIDSSVQWTRRMPNLVYHSAVPTHGARRGVTLTGGATYLVVVVLAIKLACALVCDTQLALVLGEVGLLLSTLREALGQGLRVVAARQPLAEVEPLAVPHLARLEEGVDVFLSDVVRARVGLEA